MCWFPQLFPFLLHKRKITLWNYLRHINLDFFFLRYSFWTEVLLVIEDWPTVFCLGDVKVTLNGCPPTVQKLGPAVILGVFLTLERRWTAVPRCVGRGCPKPEVSAGARIWRQAVASAEGSVVSFGCLRCVEANADFSACAVLCFCLPCWHTFKIRERCCPNLQPWKGEIW